MKYTYISLFIVLFFASCMNNKNSDLNITEDSIHTEIKKREFLNKFNENSNAPYLNIFVLDKIISPFETYNLKDGTSIKIPNQYSGNLCDIFSYGKKYVIKLSSVEIINNSMDINNIGEDISCDNCNEIHINITQKDSSYFYSKPENLYLIVFCDSSKFIPYKRITKAYFHVSNCFDINEFYKSDFNEINNDISTMN